MTLEIYETENGRYQVDAPNASYVFGPSRFRADGVECFECHPPEAKAHAFEVLEAARAQGLPL